MKVRVGVFVSINKKDKTLCSPGCYWGIGSGEDTPYCYLYLKNQKTVGKDQYKRCRACLTNELPPKGFKKCR
jgi:hypothetical protein